MRLGWGVEIEPRADRCTIALCLVLVACGSGQAPMQTTSPQMAPTTETLPTTGQPRPVPLPPMDELLITFRPGTSEARRQAIHQSVGCRLIGQMLSGRIAHVKLPTGKTLTEIQSAYATFPEVEAAEPNAPVEAQGHDTPTR